MSCDVAATVKWVKEVSGGSDALGKTENFQAVPGCGLRCRVSHLDQLEKRITQSEGMVNISNTARYVSYLKEHAP
jgi:hypothetical protein